MNYTPYGNDLWDVAVVGGGPAGAICATELAKTRMKVCLFFLKSTPSITELVSGRASKFLEESIGNSPVDLAGGIEIQETVSKWGTPGPVTWNAMCNPWGPGISVDRATFDDSLLQIAQEAGAKLINSKVQFVDRADNCWRICLQQNNASTLLLRSRFVALATGRKRTGSRKLNDKSSKLALFAILPSNESEGHGTFYLEATNKGWWYSLPNIDGSRFVGYCVDLNSINNRKLPLRRIYLNELQKTELIKNQHDDHPKVGIIFGHTMDIQPWHEICGPSWIALGDAAFAPDPLSGCGIEFAINSGKLAASVLASDDVTSIMKYKMWVNDYSRQHDKALKFYLKIVNEN
jgi:flavin-dependent dehydrogenase